jgi:glutamate synthase domain-containing protein 3
MTGGRVAVLGKIGRNFAAGMSGGIAYIWDPQRDSDKKVNHGMVDIEYLIYDDDKNEVHKMIRKHFENTGSKRAEFILENWENEKENFWKVIPDEYKKALAKIEKEEAEKLLAEKELVNG